MTREFVAATQKWVMPTACIVLASCAIVGCATTAPDIPMASDAYARMNCEQLSTEYDRLNRNLLPAGSGAGSGEATEFGFDDSITTSDALYAMDHIRTTHRGNGCATRLEVNKAAAAALAREKSVGEHEYSQNCARCHGDAGEGNGWFGKYMKEIPPPLAHIRKNNGGVFPSDHLIEVIDGRKDIKVHGPRDMPIWGRIYYVQANKAYETYTEHLSPAERVVRAKIRALVNYIAQFQD